MNKQEVIDEIENAIPDFVLNDFQRGKETGLTYALELVEELDDPEKPVVSQFIADWYEEHKEDLEYNLYRLCINFHERKLYGVLYEWFKFDKNKPIETLILMHKIGYEVKKEKLYTVELPNPNGDGYSKLYLSKNKDGKVELFQWSDYAPIDFADDWKLLKNAQLTEDEIKEDFDWAWQFKEEVEE